MIRSYNVLLLTAMVLAAGCASKPPPAPVTRQVKVDASNVEDVQKAGYKLVNRDGEKLYCRTDPVTGSHIQTRTTCLTEQELYDQMQATKQSMSRITTNNPGPFGK